MNIQDLINQANPNDIVHVPIGEYSVDAVNAPITLKSDITLDLSGVILTTIPNAEVTYKVLNVLNCNNVTIINGIIKGERDSHLASTDWSMGGHGHGIEIRGSHNIKVQNTQISDCFGDGVYIEDAYNVTINKIISNHNRRQGMSVIQVDGLFVISCQFSNSGGTPPGCGIDLECDNDQEYIRNVYINGCLFYGNQGSSIAVGSPGTYQNIQIYSDNNFDGVTQPIWTAGNAGSLGTPWYAFLLNRMFSWLTFYRYWGYPREWHKA